MLAQCVMLALACAASRGGVSAAHISADMNIKIDAEGNITDVRVELPQYVKLSLGRNTIESQDSQDQSFTKCEVKIDQETTTGKTNDDGYDLHLTLNTYYKFHTELRSWYEAQAACVSEGAHLAVINSPDEAAALVSLYDRYRSEIHTTYEFAHIGFYLFKTKGPYYNKWLTVVDFPQTLEEAGYADWNPGEPNYNYSDEYYGSIAPNGRLNDLPESVQYPFICEKPFN